MVSLTTSPGMFVSGVLLILLLEKVDIEHDSLRTTNLHLPAFCLEPVVVPNNSSSLAIAGLSPNGRLFLTGLHEPDPDLNPSHPPSSASTSPASSRTLALANNATSFTLTPSFIVYTSSSHECHFIPVDKTLQTLSTLLSDLLAAGNGTSDLPTDLLQHVEKRRVERGSRIVVAIPSTMSLVLQMPRGNLETICPRPFVLEIVHFEVTK